MITVLSLLNLAPDALHHIYSSSKRLSRLSSFEVNTVALSVKSEMITFCVRRGVLIFSPFRVASSLRRVESGSMAMLNRRHNRGSPCHMPLLTSYHLRISPFRITKDLALVYRDLTMFVKLPGYSWLAGFSRGSHAIFCHRPFPGPGL